MGKNLKANSLRDLCIDGVRCIALQPNRDLRGSLVEIHRNTWSPTPHPIQWDFILTNSRVLRGVHVHRHRWDYLIVVRGSAVIGLCDLRRDGRSFKQQLSIEVNGDDPCVVIVPPGVTHGIYARCELEYLYGLTDYYDGSDQDGCRWDDPEMAIEWPDPNPVLIQRDKELGSFRALMRRFEMASGVVE